MDELPSSPVKPTAATCAKIKTLWPVLRSATPEQEFSANCRSAHVRRNVVQSGGADRCARFRDLRPDAKPPDAASPLGAGTGAAKVVEDGKQKRTGSHMCRDRPSTRLGMLEMVFRKPTCGWPTITISVWWRKRWWPLGKELRDPAEEDIKVVLAIANDSHLMADYRDCGVHLC